MGRGQGEEVALANTIFRQKWGKTTKQADFFSAAALNLFWRQFQKKKKRKRQNNLSNDSTVVKKKRNLAILKYTYLEIPV